MNVSRFCALVLFLSLSLSVPAAWGATHHVCKPSGACAYDSIRIAVFMADDGDTILVGNGTYDEHIVSEGKSLTLKSVNGSGVTVIMPSEAKPAVIIEDAGEGTTIIDGFTIRGGTGWHNEALQRREVGGISAYYSSLEIRNSLIEENFFGGIYVDDGNLTLVNSAVKNNTAAEGIFFRDLGSRDRELKVENSLVKGNGKERTYEWLLGGGIASSALKSVIINSRIIGNETGPGLDLNGEAIVTGSVIRGNVNSGFGGGGGIDHDNQLLIVRDSIISGNNAHVGGGIASDSRMILENSRVIDNIAASSGGGLYLRADSRFSEGSFYIKDSIISGNTAYRGGAIKAWLDKSPLTMVNTIISGNFSPRQCIDISDQWDDPEDPNAGVSVVNLVNSTVTGNESHVFSIVDAIDMRVVNSILWGNEHPHWIVGIPPNPATLTIDYSIIETPFDGEGNVSVAPLFADPRSWELAPTSAGDYHLLEGSSGVDAGTSDVTRFPLVPIVDIDRDIRPAGAGHDMGADEYVSKEERHAQPTVLLNGSEGMVSQEKGKPLNVEIALEANQLEGKDAEWWVLVKTPFPPPFDWYHFEPSSRSWVPGLAPSTKEPCRDLKPVKVLNGAKLPGGTYRFYFGVDMVPGNGRPDLQNGDFAGTTVRITP